MIYGRRLILLLVPVVLIQLASAAYFILKISADLFLWQVPVIPWEALEVLELLASLGLLSGLAISLALIHVSARRINRLSMQIGAVAGEFQKYMEQQFDDWQLTPTEKNVALLVIKGFSNAEIARLRGTTESTVKSQLTSIFRKTGLATRQQLTTYLIEDLMAAVEPGERG
ncbi:response regulator transcription factor [Alkalilacustris brevis]|uniref:response regulator transcription factor n=1 Tax=Alkalilacustris brevis TaxID=2026338 RepID=UPI000E0E0118|nr:LuxR C-terminal-related transcriptional regulator [Alkalilacustris brevis]